MVENDFEFTQVKIFEIYNSHGSSKSQKHCSSTLTVEFCIFKSKSNCGASGNSNFTSAELFLNQNNLLLRKKFKNNLSLNYRMKQGHKNLKK